MYLCIVEKCSENIKADTTRGQEILKNNWYSKNSAWDLAYHLMFGISLT